MNNGEYRTLLSLWQPWASLVARGLKTIETRLEPPPESAIGRRILIHANQEPSRAQVFDWVERLYPEQMRQILNGGSREDLPYGRVVAEATLAEARPTDWQDWPQTLSPVEGFCGWILKDIVFIPKGPRLDLPAGLSEFELGPAQLSELTKAERLQL